MLTSRIDKFVSALCVLFSFYFHLPVHPVQALLSTVPEPHHKNAMLHSAWIDSPIPRKLLSQLSYIVCSTRSEIRAFRTYDPPDHIKPVAQLPLNELLSSAVWAVVRPDNVKILF